jgi:tripartite-type tricarboxylate transporter receptor subunit TctC
MCRRIRLPNSVALGKQKTQNLSFGSSGSSTPHRLAGEMLQKYGGFTMTHVPYKGTAASVNDLLGGQIPLLFGAPTAVEPLATAGKIKVLGVTSEKRFPLLPNVPAISETFPQFKIISYIGFMLQRNTPTPVIAALNKEVNQVLATDSMRAWLDKQGMVAVGGTPDDFRRQIEVDYQARGELVRGARHYRRVSEEAPSSPQALFAFFRAARAETFNAAASRMSVFNAFSSILSP